MSSNLMRRYIDILNEDQFDPGAGERFGLPKKQNIDPNRTLAQMYADQDKSGTQYSSYQNLPVDDLRKAGAVPLSYDEAKQEATRINQYYNRPEEQLKPRLQQIYRWYKQGNFYCRIPENSPWYKGNNPDKNFLRCHKLGGRIMLDTSGYGRP